MEVLSRSADELKREFAFGVVRVLRESALSSSEVAERAVLQDRAPVLPGRRGAWRGLVEP